jgi:putative restriction endonuclease
MKNAKQLGIPIFVIENFHGGKKVNLAWMNDFDDNLRICVLTFHGVLPIYNQFHISEGSKAEVELFGEKRSKRIEIEKADRDPLFKFNIMKRFQGKCLVTGIDVTEMLDAAHIIPVASGGTEHPENGLLLSASVHRALDAGLWAINPETLTIETRDSGPDAQRMKLDEIDLSNFSKLLNSKALAFRYESLFLKGKKR